jgi:thiol:disulfide interchange protein
MYRKAQVLFFLFVLLFPGFVKGQIPNPVKWSTDYQHVSGNVYKVNFRATISGDWHLYDLGPYENGPNPTIFEFEDVKGYKFVSDIEMVIKPVVKFDDMFGVDVGSFEKEAHFARTIEVLQTDSVTVKGYVEWMVCDKGSCLPPTDKEFVIKLPGAVKAEATVAKAEAKPKPAAATNAGSGAGAGSLPAGASDAAAGADDSTDKAGVSTDKAVVSQDGSNMNPVTAGSEEIAAGGEQDAGGEIAVDDEQAAGGELSAGDEQAAGDEYSAGDATGFSPGTTGEDKSMWGVIIEAIIWGFVALLTPCVFPMVPMTVSFFLKQSQQSQERELAAVEGAAGSCADGGAGTAVSCADGGVTAGTSGVGGVDSVQTGENVTRTSSSRTSSSRSSSSRGRMMASFFGLSIIALYTLPIAAIIVITYFAGGEAVTADIFNWLATHWVPNLLFFIIFMVFAASFFGAFEIVLPSWLVNKSDSKSDKGGYAGVFFMALTLVLVSFSCTGPIVGTILIKSTQGEIWEPIITMLAFSAAFALPFTIFAFAPSLLKDLPKSGGWLNSVKVVLGFIEVALGFKFLSVADQVYHWGLLDREVYLAIWIVVFTLMGLYLLGKLRFAHDSPQEYITVKRLAMSIVTFSFVVYMIPGMWGAPLKALSGYLPPMGSQDFRTAQVGGVGSGGYGAGGYGAVSYGTVGTGAYNASGQGSGQGIEGQLPGVVGVNSANHSLRAQGIVPTYSDFLHLPHGLEGFFRYQEGMEYAKKVGKPVFIDFTGHGCVNCREMEARVWSDPRVLKLLREEYVLIALYADDKKTAVEGDWITSESGRVLKSIGKINAHLAMNKYNVNAQPYYAIIDPATEEHLTDPMGYNLDVAVFTKFLQNGIANYPAKRDRQL